MGEYVVLLGELAGELLSLCGYCESGGQECISWDSRLMCVDLGTFQCFGQSGAVAVIKFRIGERIVYDGPRA